MLFHTPGDQQPDARLILILAHYNNHGLENQ
jgi:hypothetical protein